MSEIEYFSIRDYHIKWNNQENKNVVFFDIAVFTATKKWVYVSLLLSSLIVSRIGIPFFVISTLPFLRFFPPISLLSRQNTTTRNPISMILS